MSGRWLVVVGFLGAILTVNTVAADKVSPRGVIDELDRRCVPDMSPRNAERLVKRLTRLGAHVFDDLVKYATGSAPPECRAIATAALFEFAEADARLVPRFIHGLKPLLLDEELAELVPSACRDFGTRANDELIPLLDSENRLERWFAIECLTDVNKDAVKDRPDLAAYNPDSLPEERSRLARGWSEWWQAKKNG